MNLVDSYLVADDEGHLYRYSEDDFKVVLNNSLSVEALKENGYATAFDDDNITIDESQFEISPQKGLQQ